MLNPDEWAVTELTTYEFYDCRRLRLNPLIVLLVIARRISIAMLLWAQWIGFRMPSNQWFVGFKLLKKTVLTSYSAPTRAPAFATGDRAETSSKSPQIMNSWNSGARGVQQRYREFQHGGYCVQHGDRRELCGCVVGIALWNRLPIRREHSGNHRLQYRSNQLRFCSWEFRRGLVG